MRQQRRKAMANFNGVALAVMTLASALACFIAYWAGRVAR